MEPCQEKFCSDVSQAAGEDPAGTAAFYDLLILLEVPLPWEREIWKSAAFPPGLYEMGEAASERGVKFRFLCVAPNEHSQPNHRRVMIFRRPPKAMAAYHRLEYLLPPDELTGLIGRALEGEELPSGLDAGDVRDLLVCTHGTMDVACAKYGYPIYQRLRQMGGSRQLRVWRVSHFGGHRFAPTLIDLPEGRWWAHLTPEALSLMVRREGPVEPLHRFYRGWGALATPFEQVLERAILEREGWAWTGLLKQGSVLEQDPEGRWAQVAIAFRSPDGAHSGVYSGRVEVSHQVMTALATARVLEPVRQYRVSSLQRTR